MRGRRGPGRLSTALPNPRQSPSYRHIHAVGRQQPQTRSRPNPCSLGRGHRTWQKGLCRRDQVKGLELGHLSHVGSGGPCVGAGGRIAGQRWEDLGCRSDGGGRVHKPRDVGSLQARGGFFPDSAQERSPLTWMLVQGEPVWALASKSHTMAHSC